jgi:hypothetical protein
MLQIRNFQAAWTRPTTIVLPSVCAKKVLNVCQTQGQCAKPTSTIEQLGMSQFTLLDFPNKPPL